MSATTLTVVDFLRARLGEDEKRARALGGFDWRDFRLYPEVPVVAYVDPDSGKRAVLDIPWGDERLSAHIARHDPARVLREVAAKRRIVEQAELVLDSWRKREAGDVSGAAFPDVTRRERHHATTTLRALASVYADHPDYDPRWAL